MGTLMKAVLHASLRDRLGPRLPEDLEVSWFNDAAEARLGIADAEIAWLDRLGVKGVAPVVRDGKALKWLFTLGAGVEELDLGLLAERGVTLTNGVGLNSRPVAEYAVMGILAAAKRFDEVVRIADRHEWTDNPPGLVELEGSQALIIGMGAIGMLMGELLAPFGVAVTGATRSGRDGTLKPDEWRARLGEFDWVVLAAPSTHETQAMIGPEELAAMKTTAWLVNVGRGTLVDQEALIAALREQRIGGAFLDTVTPEPMPPDHPLWSAPNCMISMHLSGRSQTGLTARAIKLFLENLAAFREGRPMHNVVDLRAGY
jgi:phosphoglycerate dehydrogenase-like enzyme